MWTSEYAAGVRSARRRASCLARFVLTFGVPVAFIAYLRATVLLGRTGELSVHPALAYGAPLVGAAMFGVAYLFWRSQIQNYQTSGYLPRTRTVGRFLGHPRKAELDANLISFLLISILLIVTPGPDMALVTRNALLHGRSAALMTAIGVNLGPAVWTLAAAFGLAALLATSAAAFTTVKLVGAGYLIFLGLEAIWQSRPRPASQEGYVQPRGEALTRVTALRQGVLSNLLNPKIAIFFTTFLPQFIAPGEPALGRSLALGAMFNAITLVWLIAFALAAGRAASLLRRPRVKKSLDRLTAWC